MLGGYLKLLPMFFIVMPGMISRALYPGESWTVPVTSLHLPGGTERSSQCQERQVAGIHLLRGLCVFLVSPGWPYRAGTQRGTPVGPD